LIINFKKVLFSLLLLSSPLPLFCAAEGEKQTEESTPATAEQLAKAIEDKNREEALEHFKKGAPATLDFCKYYFEASPSLTKEEQSNLKDIYLKLNSEDQDQAAQFIIEEICFNPETYNFTVPYFLAESNAKVKAERLVTLFENMPPMDENNGELQGKYLALINDLFPLFTLKELRQEANLSLATLASRYPVVFIAKLIEKGLRPTSNDLIRILENRSISEEQQKELVQLFMKTNLFLSDNALYALYKIFPDLVPAESLESAKQIHIKKEKERLKREKKEHEEELERQELQRKYEEERKKEELARLERELKEEKEEADRLEKERLEEELIKRNDFKSNSW
jgi:hypothetical protein